MHPPTTYKFYFFLLPRGTKFTIDSRWVDSPYLRGAALLIRPPRRVCAATDFTSRHRTDPTRRMYVRALPRGSYQWLPAKVCTCKYSCLQIPLSFKKYFSDGKSAKSAKSAKYYMCKKWASPSHHASRSTNTQSANVC